MTLRYLLDTSIVSVPVSKVAVGDRIPATVVSGAGGLKLSRRLALGAATVRQLSKTAQAVA